MTGISKTLSMLNRRILIAWMYYSIALGGITMLQGKVVITFEYDEEKEKCSWELKQKGKDTLGKDDLIHLFQHIVGEYMSE